MSLKTFIAKRLASRAVRKVSKWRENPIETQNKVRDGLVKSAKNTLFGKDHNFGSIKNYEDFKNNIPVRDYEGLSYYIDKMVDAQEDILWKGKPLYFAKTSGTTSGAKYIPITKESMPGHINAARNAIYTYINETGNADFLSGKMIFLQGSPILSSKNGVKLGRLSGIVAHYVPSYLGESTKPSWKTNCIEDWDTKVNSIVEETINEKMTLISGTPSWVQMYFEKLIEKKGGKIGDIFPDFSLYIYGGVNYTPYKKKFEELVGKKTDSIELYPASEGFIAYQDKQGEEGMLLLLDNGIYYEFIPKNEFFDEKPTRIDISKVELGIDYVLILNTNAGLWGYNIGDTIRFVSLKPYKVIVTGRIKHFISAFGEHVISKEVEEAISYACSKTNGIVNEFTVAPQVNPKEGLPHHEWLVEFDKVPDSLEEFEDYLDESMRDQNIYYKDLIEGKILRTVIVSCIEKGGFHNYMRADGKLGGQNKIPKLTDNRIIAGKLSEFKIAVN